MIKERVQLGIASSVHVTVDRSFATPLVAVDGAIDKLKVLEPEQAAVLAGALLKAAAKASAPPGLACKPECVHCLVSQLLIVCQPIHNHDACALGQAIADIVASIPHEQRLLNGTFIKREVVRMIDEAIVHSGDWRDSAVQPWG